MKQFLISSFVLAFLLGTAPVMADSDQRRGVYSHTSGYDNDRVGSQHKKFLTSRYRDDYGHRGHDRRSYKEHGWRGHHGKKHHGWQKGKGHGWKQDYHGYKRHGYQHRHYYDGRHQNRHSSYRFHYNGLIGAGVSGGHISIDLSRH